MLSSFLLFGFTVQAEAADTVWVNNINIWGSAWNEANNVNNLDKLTNFESDRFIGQTRWWEIGIYNTIMQLARDLKNLFYAIATVYFLIICLKLIFASNTEEELGKFKKWILWITIWLIVMQLAFAFTQILFDQWVSARLGASLIENLVTPMIDLVRTLAAVFFIAMAIFAFYRLVTANGNEEAIKSGKMTILYALMWFILVRIAQTIVEAFYGKINCESFNVWFVTFESETCTNSLDISTGANLIINIIQWLNGFVAIVVLIMIIYAGAQIILSAGDEEKIKKWKQAIVYVAIGLFVLLANFLILTIFLRPEAVI